MENAINMNDNTIYNVKDPGPRGANQATNKIYVDTQLTTKLDKAADIDLKNQLPILIFHQIRETPRVLSISTTELMWKQKNMSRLMAAIV